MAKGFDPGEMMNQARRMKEQMARVQEDLKQRVVEGTAGGGAVKAFVNGASQLVGVKIDPEAVDPEDVSMLEDLVLAAVNNGLEKAAEMSETEMGKITGGLGLPPGLF